MREKLLDIPVWHWPWQFRNVPPLLTLSTLIKKKSHVPSCWAERTSDIFGSCENTGAVADRAHMWNLTDVILPAICIFVLSLSVSSLACRWFMAVGKKHGGSTLQFSILPEHRVLEGCGRGWSGEWPSGWEHLLLLRRTWVRFSASGSGSSEASVPPAPEHPTSSSVHVCASPHRDTQVKNEKLLKREREGGHRSRARSGLLVQRTGNSDPNRRNSTYRKEQVPKTYVHSIPGFLRTALPPSLGKVVPY